jgi:hypothetical protein
MEPEGSSPYSQEPTTCLCPEPDKSINIYPIDSNTKKFDSAASVGMFG